MTEHSVYMINVAKPRLSSMTLFITQKESRIPSSYILTILNYLASYPNPNVSISLIWSKIKGTHSIPTAFPIIHLIGSQRL